jgi:hypothetical protein
MPVTTDSGIGISREVRQLVQCFEYEIWFHENK